MKRLVNSILSKLTGYYLTKGNFADNKYDIQTLIDNKYGHKLSLKLKESVDKYGNPIPWFTYPAIEFLSQFSLKNKKVFEWGCGNSSLFFLNNEAIVTSVECDQKWFNKNHSKKINNYNLIFSEKESIHDIINNLDQKYDIILVDDKNRYNCCKEAVKHLNNDGFIILDNSDWYPKSAAFLREKGFFEIDMHGLGPINNYTWTTSFFFKTKTNLISKQSRQPSLSLGGIDQIGVDDIPKK